MLWAELSINGEINAFLSTFSIINTFAVKQHSYDLFVSVFYVPARFYCFTYWTQWPKWYQAVTWQCHFKERTIFYIFFYYYYYCYYYDTVYSRSARAAEKILHYHLCLSTPINLSLSIRTLNLERHIKKDCYVWLHTKLNILFFYLT